MEDPYTSFFKNPYYYYTTSFPAAPAPHLPPPLPPYTSLYPAATPQYPTCFFQPQPTLPPLHDSPPSPPLREALPLLSQSPTRGAREHVAADYDSDDDAGDFLREVVGSSATPSARAPLFADLNCMPSCCDDGGDPMDVEAGSSTDDAAVALRIGLPAAPANGCGGTEADLLSGLTGRGVEAEDDEECKVDTGAGDGDEVVPLGFASTPIGRLNKGQYWIPTPAQILIGPTQFSCPVCYKTFNRYNNMQVGCPCPCSPLPRSNCSSCSCLAASCSSSSSPASLFDSLELVALHHRRLAIMVPGRLLALELVACHETDSSPEAAAQWLPFA